MEDNNNIEVFVDLWKMKVSNKVQHFVWRLVWDKLPTRKNLRKERNANLIYTGSTTSRAYVQSLSNPLEIFHSLCKNPFTKS